MNIRATFKHESYKHHYATHYVRIRDKEPYLDSIFDVYEADMLCIKNDFVACQLLLWSDSGYSVTLGENTYFSAKSVADNLRVCVSGIDMDYEFHHIGKVCDDDGSYKSDILLNDETAEYAANDIACVWLEFKTSAHELGTYNGTVKIFHHRILGDEVLLQEMPFTVEVRGVELPNGNGKQFHLDLWQHNSNIARKHEVRLWSDEHFDIMEQYVSSLAELGQSAITVIASEIPWAGQLCFNDVRNISDLFEYSMARVYLEDGEYEYDFSVIERYIRMCMDYGITAEIEVFGLCNIWDGGAEYDCVPMGYPDLLRIRYYDRGEGVYKYINDKDGVCAYISALERFFGENGWLDAVRIVADEPHDVEQYRLSLNMIKTAAPKFKYKTAVGHAEFMTEFAQEIDDFVPILSCAAEAEGSVKELAGDSRHRMLWYTCLMPPVPNTFVCSHLLEARSIGWITAFMGFNGFLRWAYTAWPDKPRENPAYRAPEWRCGDVYFVYPASSGKPLLSLRYKALQRGISDFELIQMCKSAGYADIVDRAYKSILKFACMGDILPLESKRAQEIISLESSTYDAARREMIQVLEQ